MKITIVSTDTVYATMLRLELERCGFSAFVKSDASAPDTASMPVIDADSAAQSELGDIIGRKEAAIIFSRDEKLLDSLKDSEHGGTNFRYLRRPFAIDSFLAAVNELSEILKSNGGITLDDHFRTVHLRGESVTLTEQEFRLFSLLKERQGTPVSRETALSHLQRDRQTGGNIVDVYIKYLRVKLEQGFGDPMIRTVRGKGYMLP